MVTATITASVTTTVVAASASATTVSRLQFLGSGFAYYTDLAYKAGVLACKRMIEVHYHLLVGDFNHLAVDAISVGCHHRHCGAYLYKLGVKLSVDLKQLLLKMVSPFRILTFTRNAALTCYAMNVVVCFTEL